MAKVMQETRTEVNQISQEAMGEGVSQAGVSIIFTLAAAIGAWGVACLIGGVANAGGVTQLARAWFTAVAGM
jgi:hypothetical protein